MPLSKKSLEVFSTNDENEIQQYLNEHQNRGRFDVFIYTTKEGRPCVLCCVKNEIGPAFKSVYADVSEDDPFQIEKLLMVWSYVFQDEGGDLQTNVKAEALFFYSLEPKIDKLYYIGRYPNVSPRNFEITALWSAAVTAEDFGDYASREAAFAVRFCERLIDYSGVEQETSKKEEIIKNIDKMKKTYHKEASQKGRFPNYMTRLTSVLGASVNPSDFSGRGLLLLCIGMTIYSLFVAIVLKFFWFQKE